MRLVSFHVRLFRNVIDSGEIQVADTTCLVGKNEAGKSAIIEALDRLNPSQPKQIALLDEYPRWLKKEHEITGEIKNAVPITATFELSDEELQLLEESFAARVLSNKQVVASRRYEGEMTIKVSVDESTFIKDFAHVHVADLLKPKVSSVATLDDFADLLIKGSTEVDEANEPTPEAQAAKQAKTRLDSILTGSKTLSDAVTKKIQTLIPKTFYFSNYSQLRGRYDLINEVLPALQTPSTDEEIEAAAEFLKLARITPENVQTWEFEQSNAELEAISSLLTNRVRSNWKQNPHLKLSVRIESSPSANNNPNRYLQFRVEDTRHDFSSRLDRRSTGFQWFVSFIASFFEFEKDKNIILLLDEPGLSLHARAQMDLLDAIDKHLTQGRQVIYTTHSPFMVRTEALHRVRVVEDQGPTTGAVVSNDAGIVSDPDTLFPLQAALGYDIAQNLFIGNRNILVEGTSDIIYLTVMSSYLSSLGKQSLPTNCRVLPASGATNIPTFIALLGGQLDVVVLLDGDAQRQKIDRAIADGRLAKQRVLSMDNFARVRGADVEDLFTPDEYLAMYNAVFSRNLTVGTLTGSDRIVKRIERAEGEFDHGRVAAHFLAQQTGIIPTLSSETVERFERVIAALVAALPPAP